MGPLILPMSGMVYFDSNSIIYSVEKHPVYEPVLRTAWQAAQKNTIEIVTSDLTLLEVLVGPTKSGNAALATAYEQLFQQAQTRLLPITQAILREAARQRATTRLKTPDAIRAATSLNTGCALFVTNDVGFRNVPGLPVVILDDLLKP